MRSAVLALITFVAAMPVAAGYAAREAWLPIAGRAVNATGRGFYTTVYLTDASRNANDVTLSFFVSAQPHTEPRSISLQLSPGHTGVVDVGPQLVGERGAIGSLRIRSTGPLIATARVYSRAANEAAGHELGSVANAIPQQYAIGTGESTILHVPAGQRYKLYAAETHGFPLYFSVKPMPQADRERRLYLSPHEQREWDLRALFPDAQPSAIQLTAINGSGKIVAAGAATPVASDDFEIYEMSLRTEPRHRLLWPEVAAYIAAAIALAAAAFYRAKRPAIA